MEAVTFGLHLEGRNKETIVFSVIVQKVDYGDGPPVVLDRWWWEGTGLMARIESSTILSRENYISEGSEMENNKTCLMSYKVHRRKAR